MKDIIKRGSKFVNKNDIFNLIQNKIDYNKLEDALARLSENGLVYMSFDSDHFGVSE